MHTPPIDRPRPFGVLVLVELRKLVDTRSGMVLAAVAVVLSGVFGAGAVLYRQPATLGDIALLAAVPAGTLGPVIAILLVTAERTHRTALTTYALTPRRHRVLLAKASAVVAVSAAITPLALAAAVVIGPVGSLATRSALVWTVDASDLFRSMLVNIALALTGYALALAIGNAPTAIVVVLTWPMLVSLLRTASPTAGEVLQWLDMAVVGEDVPRALTSFVVWVALPALIGFRRVIQAEVR
ncbi:hypothetical protein HDA40_001821 [Hamadaea flava]|uniref:ABC transporter permease n=1 Tax=Hamadaea flava TaxID=1742688 RepID=A0ABV8LP73_9ACTN|nr:hypothetical protein [Hamadaea flava]MCP2323314.1 hypothetical protein [Hamadaea flava]